MNDLLVNSINRITERNTLDVEGIFLSIYNANKIEDAASICYKPSPYSCWMRF